MTRSVVTVCVQGLPANDATQNTLRATHLLSYINHIAARASATGVEAVTLPGGYFFSRHFLGDQSFSVRKSKLELEPYAEACVTAAAKLDDIWPGCVLAIGVDSPEHNNEAGDQFCVAWNRAGVVGIGRKVFPISGDESRDLVITIEDFAAPERTVSLPSGRRALLCSCYDGFGVSEPQKRAALINRLRVDGRVVPRGEAAFVNALAKGVESWQRLVDSTDTHLVAIHRFSRGLTSAMWQRHGIASASAAVPRGFSVAAAHFEERLPSAPQVQTLVSSDVPESHLSDGINRLGQQLFPADSSYEGGALIRWFVPATNGTTEAGAVCRDSAG